MLLWTYAKFEIKRLAKNTKLKSAVTLKTF
ncbi:MAG: hypothetical protein ACI81G_000444 [Gammaproteobacteria bacterium]